jgi:hypothetical protein
MENLNEVEDEGQGCSSCCFSTSQWEVCPRDKGGQLVCIMNHTYFEEESDESECIHGANQEDI